MSAPLLVALSDVVTGVEDMKKAPDRVLIPYAAWDR
jgi:hypothetical protein